MAATAETRENKRARRLPSRYTDADFLGDDDFEDDGDIGPITEEAFPAEFAMSEEEEEEEEVVKPASSSSRAPRAASASGRAIDELMWQSSSQVFHAHDPFDKVDARTRLSSAAKQGVGASDDLAFLNSCAPTRSSTPRWPAPTTTPTYSKTPKRSRRTRATTSTASRLGDTHVARLRSRSAASCPTSVPLWRTFGPYIGATVSDGVGLVSSRTSASGV